MSCIRFEVPVKAPSVSNLREHWATRAKRTDAQKAATRRRCPEWQAGPLLVVRLTRVAPRALDDDNLRGALKSCRDAVAQWLRVDDRTPLVEWQYGQAKGKDAIVVVEVFGAETTPVREAQFFAAAARAEKRPVRLSDVYIAAEGGLSTVGNADARRKADIRALATPAAYRKEKK